MHPALVSAAWPQGREGSVSEAVLPLNETTLRSGDIVLLGLCNEVGVLANGGRPGAAEGPAAFRAAFGRLPMRALQGRRLLDAGDIPASVPYETFLDGAEVVVAEAARAGALPLVIGGGHDCSYGIYRGLAATGKAAVLAVDAHLDVRPEHGPNSGNPFFRMIEAGLDGSDLAQVGLVRFVNAAEHETWLRLKGAALQFLEPGREMETVGTAKGALAVFAQRQRRVLATFDLDALQAAHAPGVSALNPWGLDASSALAIAKACGACPAVAALDLMELAPPLDRDGQTAKLAAFLAAAFLEGAASRPS
ncbi:MAG TPA: arginase family protein [Holophagaceae bacterium]|jgi:formiminoglutamase|nr:arginase family protein [Holophagaceae bacterium]